MSKSIFVLAATLVLAGIAMLPTVSADEDDRDKGDTLVCYTWSRFPNERFKLNIKRHSPLSEREEEKRFDHPQQTAYSVHGKEIGGCGFNTMLATTGTVVTAEREGAHIGLTAHASRANDSCRSITIDCTTDENKAIPEVWTCFSRNEFDVFHGLSKLSRVDETKDPRCSFFEDGTSNPFTLSEPEGPTSGGNNQ